MQASCGADTARARGARARPARPARLRAIPQGDTRSSRSSGLGVPSAGIGIRARIAAAAVSLATRARDGCRPRATTADAACLAARIAAGPRARAASLGTGARVIR
jgi:hypothetical protein